MKSYVFFIPVALLVLSCAKPNEKIEPVLRELDETIDNRQRFENEKQDRIARLKKDLQETDNIHKRTELYSSLFDQYKNYQYDSAFVYAKLLEKNAEILLTGWNAPEWLMEKADYISDIKSVKNPYTIGINARAGVEF